VNAAVNDVVGRAERSRAQVVAHLERHRVLPEVLLHHGLAQHLPVQVERLPAGAGVRLGVLHPGHQARGRRGRAQGLPALALEQLQGAHGVIARHHDVDVGHRPGTHVAVVEGPERAALQDHRRHSRLLQQRHHGLRPGQQHLVAVPPVPVDPLEPFEIVVADPGGREAPVHQGQQAARVGVEGLEVAGRGTPSLPGDGGGIGLEQGCADQQLLVARGPGAAGVRAGAARSTVHRRLA
jgi:hypothetical protein